MCRTFLNQLFFKLNNIYNNRFFRPFNRFYNDMISYILLHGDSSHV